MGDWDKVKGENADQLFFPWLIINVNHVHSRKFGKNRHIKNETIHNSTTYE